MQRLGPLLVAFLLPVAGCTPRQQASPSGGAAGDSEPSAAGDSAEAETARAPAKAPPAEAAIGRVSLEAPSKAAVRENLEALEQHRRGDFAKAIAGFEGAIAESPGFAKARFNRACALSRLGRLDEAAAALEPLLREDLPDYGPRLEGDEDLAGLRASPHGARLAALVEELRPAYAAALARGVPALVYEPGPPGLNTPDGPVPAPGYSGLRVGVYDHATRRFVPMAPTVREAIGAALDRERGLALVVTGGMTTGTCFVSNPQPRGAQVFDLGVPGRLLYQATGLHVPLAGDGTETPAAYLRAERDGVHVTYLQVDNAPLTRLSFEHRGGRLTPSAAHLAFAEGTVALRGSGALRRVPTHPTPDGLSVRGHELRLTEPARTIAIGAGHREPSIIPSPDGRHLLLVSLSARCRDDETGATTSHLVELVDLETGRTVELSRGSGVTVEGRYAQDGTLLLQLGDELRRYGPGSTEPATDVPAGIRLATPLMTPAATPDCDGC